MIVVSIASRVVPAISDTMMEKSGFRVLKNVVTPTARGVDEPGKMYVLYNPMKPIDKEKQPCLN